MKTKSPQQKTDSVSPRTWLIVLAIGFSILVARSAFAGGEWFTSRTVGAHTRPVATLMDKHGGPNLAAAVSPDFVTFTATGLPLAIPDNSTVGVTSNLPVTKPGVSGMVMISFHVTHTFVGDLSVTLIAPSGQQFILHDRTGGGADNLMINSLTVAGAASVPATGTWKLFVEDHAGADTGTLDSWSLSFPNGNTANVDLVMSLSANPAGDNDGNHQGQAGSAAQDKWERIVQHFADAVYEATNAAHKIRTVRIYRSGHASSTADVIWTAAGHPNVGAKGGVGEKGGHINMFETFTDGEGPGVNHDMLADEIGSGYTQAHEWCHYFYGIYDEYKINATDVAVVPSIMDSQWMATGGDFKWLNFSIKHLTGGGDFQNTLHTRQHDQHGASDWETLARMPANDIKTAAQLGLGQRIFYPEVAAAAPAAGATPRIDLPGTARSALNIVWMKDEDVYQIIIDHSGSMSDENKMEQAKAAAQLLINLLPLGKSRVGVSQFDTTVEQVQPIISLTTEADRTAVKAKIAAIVPAGSTAIGDAAQAGLATILATNLDKSNRVVFLLSDGQSNSGIDPLSVIPAYQNAQIPLFTFGFGSDADGATLQQMAAGTRGKFYSSPASLAAITTAFQDAQSVAASNPSIAAGTASLAAVTQSPLFTVDPTVGQLNYSLTHDASVASADLHLTAPNGQQIAPTDSFTVGSETLLSYSIPHPQAGAWRVMSQSNSSTSQVSFTASGVANGVTFSASVDSEGGDMVAYPAPIVLHAKLFQQLNITGVSVSADVVAPDGSVETIQFHDDGQAGDDFSGDGNYVANYRYTQNGTFTFKVNFDNSAGTAVTTYHAATQSATTTGAPPPAIANRNVGVRFTRSSQVQVTTTGGVFSA
ncbi:MAG TPA: VWA domain-containing protein, partial [Chthoniobacterales bacterium]|nr:VWA domain-containing protein [Chthoniobacterales bacterium]